MKKWLYWKMFVFAVLLIGAQSAWALTVTLGTQDFADGAKPTTGAFLSAGAGEPAPFDGVFIGDDVDGENFSASWTFSYGPLSNVVGGSLALGIYDHDSAASGDQVASFTLNGIDLTASLNALFEARGGDQIEVNVYNLTLPGSTFADLATGNVTFALSLQGTGLGIFGETDFNGAALDFSMLDVTTQGTPIPEPATIGLVLIGVPFLVRARRKMFPNS